MDTKEMNLKIDELKMEYMKVQGNIEKLESTGHSIEKLEARLIDIENELKNYRSMLSKLDQKNASARLAT